MCRFIVGALYFSRNQPCNHETLERSFMVTLVLFQHFLSSEVFFTKVFFYSHLSTLCYQNVRCAFRLFFFESVQEINVKQKLSLVTCPTACPGFNKLFLIVRRTWKQQLRSNTMETLESSPAVLSSAGAVTALTVSEPSKTFPLLFPT